MSQAELLASLASRPLAYSDAEVATHQLKQYKALFAAAEEEIIRLKAAAAYGSGVWGKERDRAGIREQVDRAKGRKNVYVRWEWIRAKKVCLSS